MLTKFESNVITELDRIAKALEITATCQIKQTQIAEQSFKEAKELRDYTMGMLKKDEKDIEFAKTILKSKAEAKEKVKPKQAKFADKQDIF